MLGNWPNLNGHFGSNAVLCPVAPAPEKEFFGNPCGILGRLKRPSSAKMVSCPGSPGGRSRKPSFCLHLLRTFTMHLLATALFVFLTLSSSTAHAVPGSPCVSDDFLMHRDTLKTAKVTLPVFDHFCYRDSSGDYVVYLTESRDRRYDGETLSSKIGAYLFKINAGPTLALKGTVSDGALAGMAGVHWRPKLIELSDIDGDGLVDPVLVYRFYAGEDGKVLNDPYEGGLKMIVFHRDAKAAIRAITGNLDLQRSTTASAPYFKLPPVLQKHLVRKMKRMYDEHQFGFDNSHAFKPQK